MFSNRLFVLIVVLALFTIAAITIQTGVTQSAMAPSSTDLTDYSARHGGSIASSNPIGASDWFERHPEVMNIVMAADLTDYFQRHREPINVNVAAGATDWSVRHPGYAIPVPAPDLSDYFQRHRIAINASDLSDWYQRHPNSP